MTKKKKKRPIYSIDQKTFDTFEEMKLYAWLNIHTNREKQGFEMIDDEIQKHYIFIKKGRRLSCIVIYNKEEAYKEWYKRLQLELFKDE